LTLSEEPAEEEEAADAAETGARVEMEAEHQSGFLFCSADQIFLQIRQ
jgi:hypothetical protein